MPDQTDVSARPIRITDVALFQQLLLDPEVRKNTWLQFEPNVETDKILHYCFLKGYQRFILETKDGIAIGTFSFYQDNAFADGGIFLLPEYRQKGYGKQAFNLRKEILKQNGVRFLRNEIFLDNTASIQNNLNNGAKPFGWWIARLETMPQQYLVKTTPHGKLEFTPFGSDDLCFYRKLFSEKDVQFQTYSEKDIENCSDEDAIRFLMANSERRWTVWLQTKDKKIPIGTTHLYETQRPASNFGFLIAPEYRGLGLGKPVLEIIKQAAIQEGIKILRADVFIDSKPAISCMEACGFRPLGFYETYLS